jgi:Tfp pilus assembly protein PilF
MVRKSRSRGRGISGARAPAVDESPAQRPRRWAAPLIVAAATFLAFLPALRNGFVAWDDDRNFVDNLSYRGLGWNELHWMWTTFHLGHYVPLAWMTLGLDYALWGMDPAGYHLTSVLIHCGSAGILYFLAARLLRLASEESSSLEWGATIPAAFAALLFAIHPLRVESVAWVTERRDVLSELFYLSSLLLYIQRQDDDARGGRRYWLSLVLFACALLSKATSVTLPVILLILDVYPLRRLGGARGWWNAHARRVLLEKIPFALLALVVAVVSMVALPPRTQLSLAGKIAVSSYSLCLYLWKTIAPLGLSPLYPMPLGIQPTAWTFVACEVAVLLMCVAAFVARRRWPAATAAWLAFVVITLPMLGLVQNGPQIAADRYTYHASPVLALMGAAILIRAHRRWHSAATWVGGAVLVCLAALTWSQTAVWHDSMTLWSSVLRREPGSALAHNGVGVQLAAEGRVSEAIGEYERAVSLDGQFAEGENNLGVALVRSGDGARAIGHFERAVAIKPDYADARNNLGTALGSRGALDRAIEQFTRALAIDPTLADAEFNWGNALFRQGDASGAIAHYRAALRLKPGDPDATSNMAVAVARVRQQDSADREKRQVRGPARADLAGVGP